MFPRYFPLAMLGLASAWGCSGSSHSVTDAGEQPINYTFDTGTEGWLLNVAPGYTNFANLGVGVPDGGSPATLEFVGSDGDPSPGALRLAVTFTGPGQYAAAQVGVGAEGGLDISGKTLHARFRLVSGSAAGVSVSFYFFTTGPVPWGVTGPALDAAELAAGAWVPMAWDLGATGDNWVFALGIEVYIPSLTSADGGAGDGGAFASTRDLVFEIDTVTLQ
jgi:hypothetical protein